MLQRMLPLAGSLCRKFWQASGMANIQPGAGGHTNELLPNQARTCRLTIIEGRPIFVFGTGEGTCVRWEISRESLRGVALDSVAELLNSRD